MGSITVTLGRGGYFFALLLYAMARIKIMIIAAIYSTATPPFIKGVANRPFDNPLPYFQLYDRGL